MIIPETQISVQRSSSWATNYLDPSSGKPKKRPYESTDGKALIESRGKVLSPAAQPLKEEEQGGHQLQMSSKFAAFFLGKKIDLEKERKK